MQTKSNILRDNVFTRHPLLSVFTFTAICLLPAMLMRDFTPSNELRYLSIADEAIADGHIFAFYNHGIPYADKPPLYIWCVMLCRILFGQHSCFFLTLFSLVPAFVITWIMDRWVMKGASAADRMATAMMLLTCIMFLGTAAVIRMDMLMCMFIVLALYTFSRMYDMDADGITGNAGYRECSYLLPVWIFLALFTKGPVGLLVPPISIAVFLIARRKWRSIGKYLGWKTWGIIAGLSAIWFICVYFDGGKSYLDNLLFKQTVGRAVNAFTHSKPFWFYFVAIWWCLAPYCLLLLGAFIAALVPSGQIRSDRETLFICVIASTVLMLSSFSSKLPIYLVPAFPFIVYLFPMVLERIGGRRWMLWAVGIPAGIFTLAGAAAILVLGGIVKINALEQLFAEYPFIGYTPVKIAAILLTAGNALAIWFLIRRRNWNLPVFLVGSSLLLTVYAASGVLTKANAYLGYGAICREVPEGTDVFTLYVSRPENMDVYLGRQITDYEKNPDSLVNDVLSRTPGDNPVTIITYDSRIDSSPELKRLFRNNTVTCSGPFSMITCKPASQGISDLRNLSD
jgi:4-amino-4-deoxy-L-arabinose transferase-like glycosyltransferase